MINRLVGAVRATALSLGLTAGLCAGLATAAPRPDLTRAVPTETPAPVAGAHPLTAADLDSWLDGYLPYALKRGGIAGASVSVVKDGQVLFEKGYGLRDVAHNLPMDPKTTLIRPGSISKLFTWTAVMQLVEQGKLNLDADVNTYIDFKIPARNGKPVTLRNIMTHTAGFEESIKGLITDDPKQAISNEVWLKRFVPKRVYDPGTVPAYSNYATALAGYIIQRASGEPFDAYIQHHIFAPLDMQRSSFSQPLPANLKPLMSTGYVSDDLPGKPFEFVNAAPAGSLSTSADDMAHFMIAHLQDGRYGDQQILKPETARMMHTTALTITPFLNRMDLGFYEQNINGHQVISHGGDTQYFHSELYLYLNDHVGLFMSFNSPGKAGAVGVVREYMFEAFSDRYFPAANAPAAASVDAKTAAAHAKLFAGNWASSRAPFSSFMDVINLLGQSKFVTNPDGTISFTGGKSPSGALKRYKETEPFLWTEVGGHDRLAAKVENGKIAWFSIDQISPFMVFRPVPAARSSGWIFPAGGAALAALFLTLLAWPIAARARSLYGARFALTGDRARAWRYERFMIVGLFVTLIGWFFIVSSFGKFDVMGAIGGSAPLMLLIQALTVVTFAGGFLLSVWNAFVAWTQGASWFGKLWSVVLALSFFVLAWTAAVFHMMSFTTKF